MFGIRSATAIRALHRIRSGVKFSKPNRITSIESVRRQPQNQQNQLRVAPNFLDERGFVRIRNRRQSDEPRKLKASADTVGAPKVFLGFGQCAPPFGARLTRMGMRRHDGASIFGRIFLMRRGKHNNTSSVRNGWMAVV